MSVKTAKRSAKYLNTSSLNRPLMMLGAATALLAAGPAYALDANTLPQDPNVVGGSASFSQSGNTLNVNQSTNRAVIDWRSFDIGSNAQTNFAQPNAASIAVNRVNQSANPTQIQGGLHANGQVWILNPNGVVFGKTAHVDAAGIVASTANIDVNAFMGGSNTLHMSGADHGSVVNEGSISVGESGLAAFVAPSVRNSGTITAKVGKVTLAAGTSYTLDLAGDNLVEIGLGAGNALVDQSGKIVNAGGTVQLSAKAASDVVDSIINVSGVIDASSVVKDGGTIVLAGDNINTSSTAKLAADAGTNGNGGTITSIANKTGNYAGSFSAKGGSESGDGGQIETSGKTISVSKDVSVDTLAANGKTGNWTLDPDDLTIADGANEGAINPSASTVNNATIVNQLSTTGVTLAANNSITVNGAIDSSAQSNSSVLALNDQDGGGLTVNLNAPITLGTGQSLTGQGTIVNVGAGSLIQNGVDVALDGGATVNVAAGTYADPAVSLTKSGIALVGASGAKITVTTATTNGIDIWGDNNSVSGFEISGPAAGTSYLTFAWGGDITRGIAVHNGAANFAITGNNIHGLRNDVLIDGRNTGSVTGNTIDNSKSGISVQYTDAGLGNTEGYAINISGNTEGTFGNEWGVNFHLNGHYDDATTSTGYHSNSDKIAANAPGAVQQALLTFSSSNGGMTAQDQGYSNSNRTAVTVGNSGSDASQGSPLGPLATVGAGVNAVVSGGTVNVQAGSYTLPGQLNINKSLTLAGAGVGSTNITSNSTGYGINVTADNTTLSGFTYNGPTGTGATYGIKVQPDTGVATDRILNFAINNVAINGGYRTGLDINGANGATIDNVSVTGIVHGNGMALTDSANVTITNSTTSNNAWGGLALYQTNNYYDQQVTGISVDGTNTFNDVIPVYSEDESATNDFGTVSLAGFSYVVNSPNNANDVYSWFQKTQQDAINFATDGTLSNGNVNLPTATVQGYTGSGVTGNNIFTVGIGDNSAAMSIGAATNAATSGATVNVLGGTYIQSSQVVIDKDLTIAGDSNNRPTITTGADFTGNNAANAWFLVDAGVNFGLSNAIIDGSGHNVWQALRSQGNTTVDNVDFRNIAGSASGSPYRGVAIESFGGTVAGGAGSDTNGSGGSNAHLIVTNSTFTNIGREGILIKGDGSTADITGNTYTGKGTGDWLDYGIEVGASGQATITGNTITGALGVAATDGSTSAGIMVTSYYGGASHATIENNVVTGNTTSVVVGYDNADVSIVHATNNDFSGNTYGAELTATTATADFSGNWWGSTDAATIAANMGGAAAASIDFSPFLMSGTDTDAGTVGFQGDFSDLAVTTLGGGVADRIGEGVADVSAGGTVNVLAGNYTLPGQLNINKSLTLSGAGVGSTNITSNSTGYGIYVTADNVTLSSFNYNANPSGSYSFKVSPGGAPSSRVNNFAIDHVTINNSKRTGLDLNGVNGATIDNVAVYNTTSGNGITLTDSANVTITHSMTSGNAWGGLALYQANFNYDQQVNNITVDGTNTFNESNGIYAQDQSATNDFGIVDLSGQGIQYVGQIATGGGDGNYTLFQKTQQGAIDLADAFNTRYSLTAATVQGYDESTKSVAGNNTFYVGEATGGDLLSINAAVVAAISGGTVNVLGGTYAERVTVNKSLTLAGAGMDSTYLTDGIQIPNSPAITGLTFKDFTVSGDGGTGAVVKQGRVTDFTMEGVRIDGSNVAGRHGFASGKFDGAISITNSEFVNIRGWSAFDTSTGGALGHLTSVVFSGNLLDNSAGHIVFRQSTPTVGVTISNNIVRNVGDTTDLSSGIFKVFGATTVDFSGNNISDISANGAGHPATTSGILDGAALIVNGVDTLNVTNNTFTNNQEAILIGDGNALPTTTNFTGNTFTNNAYDIQLAGGTGAGTLIFGAGNNFVSGAQTQQHLLWGGSGNIDMTQVQFDGKIGSAMTNDELFAAEDLITDGLDNGTSGFASLKAGNVYVTQASGSIQNGVNAASSGNTVNVQAGNYALPSTLHIGTSLTLTGAGEGSTTIDGSGVASGYAIDVAANNVSLGGFTLNGSSDLGGIDVQTTAAAGAGATGFQIANVTINNQSGYGMSVVGGSGATIDNLTIDGSTGGDVGVAINDSANVTITNTKTSGNEIGLGVYQTGDTSSQQLTGLSVDTTNNFSEDAPVYILDAGTGGQELGALSILGFGYAIGNTTDLGNAAVLQTTQQNAINNSVALTTPSDSFVVGWTGSAVTTTYTVGTSTGGTAMSIAAALGHSASGNTINVLTGTYGEAVNVTGLRTLNFGTVTLNSLTLGAGAAGSSLTGTIAAGSVALNGAVTLSGATTLNTSAANGNVTTSAIDGNQALTINAGTGAVSLGNLGATTRLGAVSVTGPATLTGTTYAANSLSLGSATLSGDTTLDTTGALTTGAVDGAHALTVKAASASLGNLGATTRLGAVSVTGPATLTGTTYAANSLSLGSATLSGDTTLDATGALTTGAVDGAHDLTVKAASASLGNLGATTRLGAVSVTGPATLTGTTYAGSSLSFGGAVTLASNATLDATGALTTGAVDGAHALTVNAASASLGNLGATTRLGAVSVTGPATLTGTTYAANSLSFGGAVTLSGDTTMSSVNGGGITVAGNLFGAAKGGQNLTLNAGTGTGALSANGDISLQNVGTSGTRLNNLTVSGNNFSAATVYLAGNFSATLLGNQVFTSQTLNAGGTVNSNVGGNAIGPINAGGAVNMNVGGNLSGNINGTAITLNTGSITGSTITGTTSITANSNTISTSVFNAPTIDAHASSVQGTLNGDTIALDATQFANVVITGKTVNVHTPAGVVTGTWDTIGTDGSGILAINGETTLGVSGIGPNQLVVEGFALPAGTTVTPSGALVLPTGVLVGLLSPAGASGQPKVVLVHSVQRLGELLANGYTAIVIDLNNKKKEDKEIVVASN